MPQSAEEDDPRARLIAAHEAYTAGRTDEAERLLLAALERGVQPGVLALLGQIAADRGATGEAVALLGAACDAAPDAAGPRLILAGHCLNNGLAAEALEAAEQALLLADAAADSAAVCAAHDAAGLACEALDRPDAAEAAYERATKAAPDQAVPHHHLGLLHLRRGHVAKAEAPLRRALARKPGDGGIAQALALTLDLLGRFADALPFAEIAAGAAPASPAPAVLLARLLLSLDRADEAEAPLRAALTSHPDAADAHLALGHVLAARGQARAALDAFRSAQALAPEMPATVAALAQALDALDALDEAAAVLESAPDAPEIRLLQAHLALRQGEFAAGFAGLAALWRAGEGRFSPLDSPAPPWAGEAAPDKTLLVDAGLDPTVLPLLLRWLPQARQRVGRLVLVCREDLRRLADRLPGVDAVVSSGPVPGGHDVQVPLMVLPALLGPSGPVPGVTLTPPPSPPVPIARLAFERWGKEIASGPPTDARLSIGLVADADGRAGPTADALAPLAQLTGVRAFSLGATKVPGSLSLAHRLPDLAEAAALLSRLDLLVCGDGVLAHLAGALATPTWLLLPPGASWAWGTGQGPSSWYPRVQRLRLTDPPRLDGAENLSATAAWVPLIQRLIPPLMDSLAHVSAP